MMTERMTRETSVPMRTLIMSPLIISIGLCALLVGCGSPEERATNYLTKAEALFEAGDIDAANIEALNAAQIEPRNAQARMLLAKIAKQRGNYREAIGHLLVAVDADPRLYEGHVQLGNFYFFVGATTPATEQAELAMAIAPEDKRSRLLNARVQAMTGNREVALEEVDAALQADLKFVGAIAFKAGCSEEAAKSQAAPR